MKRAPVNWRKQSSVPDGVVFEFKTFKFECSTVPGLAKKQLIHIVFIPIDTGAKLTLKSLPIPRFCVRESSNQPYIEPGWAMLTIGFGVDMICQQLQAGYGCCER